MNRERAEAHLRLLAETEPRRAAAHPGSSTRVKRVAQALTAGEVYLLQASRGLLTMIARARPDAGMFSFLEFSVTDDKGSSYGLGLHGSGPAEPGWTPTGSR